MIKSTKSQLILLLVVCSTFLLVGNAFSYSIDSLFSNGGITRWNDSSAEYVINGLGNDDNTTVDEGDYLITILEVDEIKNDDPNIDPVDIGGSTGFEELTGILLVKVNEGPSNTTTGTYDGVDLDFGDYSATSLSQADWNYLTSLSVVDDLGFDISDYINWFDGYVASFYVDSNPDYTMTTVPGGIDSATNGDEVLELSLDPNAGDYVTVNNAPVDLGALGTWQTNNPNSIEDPLASEESGYLLNLTITTDNWAAIDFDPEAVNGDGDFVLKPAGSPFGIHDDANFRVGTTVVPEPTTVLFMGLGLLSMAATIRRKQSS